MMRSVGENTIEVTGKIAVIGREVDRFLKLNKALGAAAILDDLGDGARFEVVLFLICSKVADPGHGAILMHYLAEDSGRWKTCHPRKINGGLGVAGPPKNTVICRLQREDVTRLNEGL